MRKINYEKYQETVYFNEINGLRVVYLPKENYRKTCVNLTVDYGGSDLDFIYNGKEYHSLAGTAHFIEHKIFEMADGSDAFFHLSSLGADANAYTTNKKTSYLFSTTTNVKECLNIFFDYLFTDTFNKDSIEREKGIIVEELSMYLNEPTYLVQTKLLANMFYNLHLNKQILGDRESIMNTNLDVLQTAYKAFYHPSNMILYVTGKMNLEELDELIASMLAKYQFPVFDTKKLPQSEPLEVVKELDTCNINSDVTYLAMGIKLNLDSSDFYYNFIVLYAFCYMVLSKTNEKIVEFLENGLIYEDFSYYFEMEEEYSYLELLSSINNQDIIVDEIFTLLDSCEKYLTEEALSRFKNLCYANFIYQLENIEELGEELKSAMFSNYDYFALEEVLNRLNLDDVLSIKSMINRQNVSVMIGKKDKE